MSRAQKYHSRPRHLYALLFANRHCYVGQSVDLKRRNREHKRDWPDDFEMIHLGTMQGSQAQAEEYEYVWRWKAHRAGWRNYGKDPTTGKVFVIRNPEWRMQPQHYRIADGLRWPKHISNQRQSNTLVRAVACIAMTFMALVLAFAFIDWMAN